MALLMCPFTCDTCEIAPGCVARSMVGIPLPSWPRPFNNIMQACLL